MTAAIEQQQMTRPVASMAPQASLAAEDRVWPTTGAVIGALSIASVPLLSGSPGLSLIPQGLALLMSCFAVGLLTRGLPSMHIAMLAHLLLVAFWGITLLEYSDSWQEYQTLLKVTVMGLAAHVVFRSRKHLIILFSVYAITGIAAVTMNWDELRRLGSQGGAALSESDRFAGSFANANSAGIYGVMLILSGLVCFYTLRHKIRWLLAGIGISAGIAIFFFSGSRKGMLGMAFLLAMLPWLAASGTTSLARSALRAAGIGMVVISAGVIMALTLPFMDRLIVPFTQGAAAESSSEYRLGMLVRAFDLWTQHPLVGCGFDGFARLSEFGVYSHSTFSEVICNGGIVGLFLMGVFYILPPNQLLSMALHRKVAAAQGAAYDKMPLCLLAFWGVFAIFSLFAVLYDSREFVPLYAAVCGYISARRSRRVLAPEGGAV